VSAYRTNNFPSPPPKQLSSLSRAQVAARIAVVREAIDMMVTQTQMDGGVMIECVGAAKVSLFHLERDLAERDRKSERGEPLPHAVALALAGRQDAS
jgi:hypothetical protein